MYPDPFSLILVYCQPNNRGTFHVDNTRHARDARSEHLPLGLQEFVDYTNWKGTKLNVVGSEDMEGFSGEVPAHFKSETVGLMPNGWLPPAFIPPSVDILADQALSATFRPSSRMASPIQVCPPTTWT